MHLVCRINLMQILYLLKRYLTCCALAKFWKEFRNIHFLFAFSDLCFTSFNVQIYLFTHFGVHWSTFSINSWVHLFHLQIPSSDSFLTLFSILQFCTLCLNSLITQFFTPILIIFSITLCAIFIYHTVVIHVSHTTKIYSYSYFHGIPSK